MAATLVALALPSAGRAQVTIVREPVYEFDARAIVGANRTIARTRFARRARSSIPRELAVVAAHGKRGTLVDRYERFFRDRLAAFVRAAPALGIRLDDAGDARACFIQAAFKVYDGQGFADAPSGLTALGLWGEGAIAWQGHMSSSLARLTFRLRIKYVMGANPRFAALSDAGKQRVYDFYALGTQLIVDAYLVARRRKDEHELAFARSQARRELRADLGVDPDRVRFTGSGIEIGVAKGPR